MKNFIYIISLLLLTGNVFAQTPTEKKLRENIVNNEIKSQVQWNYKYRKGKLQKDGYINFTKKFDKNGNVIEEVYYKAGSINQKLNYKYDNNENKVEYVNYKGNENKIMFKQDITYDKLARKIKEVRFNGTDTVVIDYKYDNKDRLINITRKDRYGDIAQKRTFVYKNNICNVAITDENNNNIGKIVNKYDNNNNIIETTEYDKAGEIKEQYFYTFDGELVKEKTKYAVGNFIYKETYKYNSNGDMVEIIKEQPKGKSIVNNIYKYDSTGKLIEEEWYDNNPSENSKKTYIYNKKGILEKVEVYYSLYKYRIQYQFDYTFF